MVRTMRGHIPTSLIDQPEKRETTKKFKPLIVKKGFLTELNAKFDGQGWGSVVNNPCQFYKTPDGRIIEAYGVETFGFITSAFIEED